MVVTYLLVISLWSLTAKERLWKNVITDYHRGLDISGRPSRPLHIPGGTNFESAKPSLSDDVTGHLSKKGDRPSILPFGITDWKIWLRGDLLGIFSMGQSDRLKYYLAQRGLSKTMTFVASYLGIKTDGQVTAQDGCWLSRASYATAFTQCQD